MPHPSPCARLASALLLAPLAALLVASSALAAPDDAQRIARGREIVQEMNVLRALARAEDVSARLRAARPPSTATLAGLDGPSAGTPAPTH